VIRIQASPFGEENHSLTGQRFHANRNGFELAVLLYGTFAGSLTVAMRDHFHEQAMPKKARERRAVQIALIFRNSCRK
jgi:hypothetical protein